MTISTTGQHWFKSDPYFQFQFPANAFLGRQQWITWVDGPLSHQGAWIKFPSCRLVGSESAGGNLFSVCLFQKYTLKKEAEFIHTGIFLHSMCTWNPASEFYISGDSGTAHLWPIVFFLWAPKCVIKLASPYSYLKSWWGLVERIIQNSG